MMTTSERELVDAAQGGSDEAFAALVEWYRPAIIRYALRITHDVGAAEDVAQDAFVRAYRYLGTFKAGTSYRFGSWLFTIARNEAIDSMRRLSPNCVSLESLVDVASRRLGPDAFVLRDIDAQLVRSAVATLPTPYREPLELRLEGWKYSEIASYLAIPMGTVRVHIHRAKEMLRGPLAHAA